jgi:hypothetical protein
MKYEELKKTIRINFEEELKCLDYLRKIMEE